MIRVPPGILPKSDIGRRRIVCVRVRLCGARVCICARCVRWEGGLNELFGLALSCSAMAEGRIGPEGRT